MVMTRPESVVHVVIVIRNGVRDVGKLCPRTVAYGSRTAHRGRQVDARFELNSA